LDARGKPLLKDDSHLRSSFVRSHFDAFDRFVLLSPAATAEGGAVPPATATPTDAVRQRPVSVPPAGVVSPAPAAALRTP
jgi:hypothetical protein